MIGQVLIAFAAGCASAAMFASIVSGALISLVLLYLSPLPLMVVAIGWGPLWAATSGIVAAIGLGATFGFADFVAYAIAVALPACWLGRLSLLGRPAGNGTAPHEAAANATPVLEWYPLGRILLWMTSFSTLATGAALLTLGSDATAIAATLRNFLMRVLAFDGPLSADNDRWIDAMVRLAPAAAAIVAMLTLTLNLWLAARVAATSGRLPRPWPDLKTAALPPMTLVALCVTTAFCFSGGLLAMLAKVATSALMMAYALTGFAVLHTLTLPLKSRAFWLGSAYAFVVVFGWPMLAMSALGLADAVFGLRRRYLRTRRPPLPTP